MNSHLETDIIGGFPVAQAHCMGCGKQLLLDNAWMADGCPCNHVLGVNNLNETRWRLLMQLQQSQHTQLEAAKKAIALFIGSSDDLRRGYNQRDDMLFEQTLGNIGQAATAVESNYTAQLAELRADTSRLYELLYHWFAGSPEFRDSDVKEPLSILAKYRPSPIPA